MPSFDRFKLRNLEIGLRRLFRSSTIGALSPTNFLHCAIVDSDAEPTDAFPPSSSATLIHRSFNNASCAARGAYFDCLIPWPSNKLSKRLTAADNWLANITEELFRFGGAFRRANTEEKRSTNSGASQK